MLSVSATFASSDDVALGEASDEITMEKNVLTTADAAIESNDSILAAQGGDIVTNDTFFNYFDDGGTLLDNVTADELVFEGDFREVNVNYICVGKPIKFTGKNATFEGITFVINSDNVTIDKFTIIQYSDLYAVSVQNGVENIVLSNNVIDYAALEGFDSYAIYAQAVNNLNIINNTILYVGNTDGTVVNNAVRIEGDDDEDNPVPASNIVVSGNTFDLQLPSVDVAYDPDTYAATYMSQGIVFYYCEDLEFVDNRIDLRYNTFKTAYGFDSLYAISVTSDEYSFGEIQSKDITIADNTINVDGHAYAYAVSVCADNFNITGNNITVTAETNLGHGIDVNGPSSVGVVSKNDISVESPLASYGIYSYQYMGAIEDIVYSDNTVEVTGYASAGMEIVECNPEITGNVIIANGNYTYGILASIRDEGEITGNIVTVLGSNIGKDATGDPLMPKNSMGISVKGDTTIEGNNIESTNIGINLVEDGEFTINDNNIKVETNALIDSYGIYSHGLSNITVTDNTFTFVGSTDGTVVNNAVRIEGDDDEDKPVPASNIVVSGNTFDLELPSVDVAYDPDTWAATTMSEGIVFYYCEDLEFVDNRVELEYNTFTTAQGYDSLYAVSVKSDVNTFEFIDDELAYPILSKDILMANNTIEVKGHAYAYGITVAAENFEVSGNNVTVTSEINLGHAIDVVAPAFEGLVDDNWISVEAPAAYGIYSDGSWSGPVDTVTYSNNKIEVTGYLAGAFELLEKAPSVIDNIIVANGNYTYGVVASIYDEGEIRGNEIILLGSDEGTMPTGDSLMPKNSMGISVKGNCLIDNNIIVSPNIGINLVEDGKVNVTNNHIDVDANAQTASYAIHAKHLSNLTIADNEIKFVGNTDGSFVNNAILVEGDDDEDDPTPASNIVVSGNTFDLELPSVDVGYDPDTWAATTMSEGIVFYYCEELIFVGNEINLKYNDVTTAYGYDSLYAVSVKSDAYTIDENNSYPIISKRILIAGNKINLEGHAYAYGIMIAAEDFAVNGNLVNVTSEINLGHGIDVGAPSSKGEVDGNDVFVEATAAYGIYSADGSWLAPVDDITYSNNNIFVEGYLADAFELMQNNPYVINNTVYAIGNYTYGVVASIYDEGEISGNEIIVLGSNIGKDATGDSLTPKNSMAISVKGNSTIAGNTLESTDIGIKLVEDGYITVDNNVITVKSNTQDIDNHAIAAKGIDDLTISNNEINYVGASTPKENYTTAKAYAVYVVDSLVNVENNTMDITVPSLPADWEEVPPGSWNYVRHAYTEGLVFDGCDLSSVLGNNITLNYDGGSYGSIYVIDVLDSDNFIIDGNSINATGENYIYGIIVEGDSFVISNNEIWTESDYYANGIDVEESAGGLIVSNIITTIAPGSVYPIYGGMVGTPSVEISDNQIYGNSYFAVGVEFSGQDATIIENIVNLGGNYTIGIGVNVDNLTANGNVIITNASNIGDISIWDSIGTDTTGIKSKKGEVTVIDNKIFTTGEYSVDIADADGTVHDNFLISDKLMGDASVYSTGIATVYDNAPIMVSDLEKVYNDGKTLNVTVIDEFGEPMSDANIIATIGSNQFEATTDADGQARFVIDELKPGNYTAYIGFADSTAYNGATATANVVVYKLASVVSADDVAVKVGDENGKFVATLTNADGVPLSANVVVTLNGVDYALKSNSKGQVSVSTADLAVGEYNATVVYKGNSKYNASSATAKVVVEKLDCILSADDVNVNLGDPNGKFVATLTNVDGVPLSANVVVTLNGVTYAQKSNSKGQVIIPTADLEMGEYVATVVYKGNSRYNPTNTTAKVTVKLGSVVSADDVVVSCGDANGKFVATLTNVDGVPLRANVVVTLNGVTYAQKSDSKGQVIISTADLDIGEYVATVVYKGNSRYNPSSTTAKVTVNDKFVSVVSADDVVVSCGDPNGKFVATLTNESGTPLSANVVVTINGVTYTQKSNSKGQVIIPTADLDIGEYTATVTYKGNSRYNPSTTTAKVVVNDKLVSVVSADDVTVKCGDENSKFVATLTNVDGVPLSANVVVTLNGVDYAMKSDSKGKVSVSTADLDIGEYTATVTYKGNSKYNPSSTTAKVVVNNKLTSCISGAYNAKTKEVVGKLTNSAGTPLSANVVINLNGVDYAMKSDSKGQFKVSTADLAPGSYTAKLVYKGNSRYNPSSTTINVVIS